MANDVPDQPGDGLLAAADTAPDAVRAIYDDWASGGAYDDDVASWGYQTPEHLAALVVAGTTRPQKVLDAGCGTGRGGVALRAAGIDHIVGGDFSETSLAEARARNVYDEVVPLDLDRPLGFDDAEFTAVISAGVFSYIIDSEPALRELLRVVRAGGLVALSQRTDLWEARGFDAVLNALVDSGICEVDVSDPVPYLPGHPDFGDDVGVRIVQLHRTDEPIRGRRGNRRPDPSR